MSRIGLHDDFAAFISRYLEGKIQKITINTALSCPNRDGTKGRGGCTYCNNRSFSPAFASAQLSVTQQLAEGRDFFARKYPHMRYLAYFQSYTSTNAPVETLLAQYREALEVPSVAGIVIGTRPDCMPPELLDALQELSQRTFIMIEYGAESSHDSTLRAVNRCHTWADTCRAVQLTHEAGIPVGLHFIMGLPGESREDMFATIDAINLLPVDMVKFHHMQIIAGTRLAVQYQTGEAKPTVWTPEEYLELCCEIVGRLRSDIAIERFVASAPSHMVIAPRWGLKNYQFAHMLRSRLSKNMQNG